MLTANAGSAAYPRRWGGVVGRARAWPSDIRAHPSAPHLLNGQPSWRSWTRRSTSSGVTPNSSTPRPSRHRDRTSADGQSTSRSGSQATGPRRRTGAAAPTVGDASARKPWIRGSPIQRVVASGPFSLECRRVGRRFSVTTNEWEFLQQVARQRGGDPRLPSRCPPCRHARRQDR